MTPVWVRCHGRTSFFSDVLLVQTGLDDSLIVVYCGQFSHLVQSMRFERPYALKVGFSPDDPEPGQ